MKKINLKRTALDFCLLMVFWLILSGHYDFFHVFSGVISVAIVVWFNAKLRNYYFFDERDHMDTCFYEATCFKAFGLIYYILFLIWEIICSSLRVAYLIVHPKMPIKTGLIKFKTKLPSMAAKVLLGNSITLTPGTVTLQIDQDEFLVHSLTSEADAAFIDHSLAVEVARLYGMAAESVVFDEEIISSADNV